MSGMEQDNHIDGLIAKLAEGTLTEAELALLVDWYNSFDDTHVVLPAGDGDSVAQLKVRLQQRLMERVQYKPAAKRRRIIKLLPYAAAVLLAVIGLWYFAGNQVDRQIITTPVVADIAPGGNRATLTLADGRTVTLSEEQEGIVVGDAVTYLDGSSVVGNGKSMMDSDDMRKPHRSPVNYQLTTPNGGTYQVTLPDGTQVWLNAASTLKYPSRFEGNERVVELIGEAYFSVTKATAISSLNGVNIPFKVISNGQEIEVLGTEFNIAAYPADTEMKTTLVTGKVKVVSGNESVILKPGQQSAIDADGIHVQAVETAPYIAWKSGRFHFWRTPLEEILKQISRWYDVEVIYKKEIPRDTFSGKVKRDVSLRGVLSILQLSTIEITLEGKTLIVN